MRGATEIIKHWSGTTEHKILGTAAIDPSLYNRNHHFDEDHSNFWEQPQLATEMMLLLRRIKTNRLFQAPQQLALKAYFGEKL